MKAFHWQGLIPLLFVTAAAAKENESVLMHCHKTYENRMQVAACMDNAYRNARLRLESTEQKLFLRFIELERKGAKKGGINDYSHAAQRFKHWREDHCRMVQASYSLSRSSVQAYTNCLIEITDEQTHRLERLLGIPSK